MSFYPSLTIQESSDASSFSSEDESIQWNTFSRKVFVGGLPFDVTEDDIRKTFGKFGYVHVNWPYQSSKSVSVNRQPPRFVFLIYRSEAGVHRLLANCTAIHGQYFICMDFTDVLGKTVQVRPWCLKDYFYISHLDVNIEPRNIVFINNIPRPTRAIELVKVLENRFGTILYASLDIDPKLRYPRNAARIVFGRRADYVKAVTFKYVDLPHYGSTKRLDIKPYIIRESMCSSCGGDYCDQRFATYFCPEPTCLQYYCERCWNTFHYKTPLSNMSNHLPYVWCGRSTRQLTYMPHLVSESPCQIAFATTTQNIRIAAVATAARMHLYHQHARLFTHTHIPLLSHVLA